MTKRPKAGTSGVVESVEGYRLSYTDIPMSGEILNDFGAGVPEGNGEVYWVRHSLAGVEILGPVLHVVETALNKEVTSSNDPR